MIPKIHAKGASFKGCVQYLMHDKEADTSERVEWTSTRNLATDNPDAAWKVMAATAMDADRLKKEAGVSNAGRKSNTPVLHITLSWHADEREGLTPEEQMRAVNTVLHVMKASDRQALVVSHNDEPQPHVHVVVNRVSAEDGRMLSSSFEKMKASRWAQKYEEERAKSGQSKIYCHNRIINNAARDRGEFTRGEKNKARHVHEMEEQAKGDRKKEAVVAANKAKTAAIAKAERLQKARHKAEWETLQQDRKAAIAKQQEDRRRAVTAARDKAREAFRPRFTELHHRSQAELEDFEKREATFIGRMKNAVRSIDFKSLVDRNAPPDQAKASTMRQAFQALGDAGLRLQTLQKEHKAREDALAREQRKAEEQAKKAQLAEQAKRQAEQRTAFEAKRSAMMTKQAMENAKIKADWLQAGRDRRAAYHEAVAQKIKRSQDQRVQLHDRMNRRNPTPANDRHRGGFEQGR